MDRELWRNLGNAAILGAGFTAGVAVAKIAIDWIQTLKLGGSMRMAQLPSPEYRRLLVID
jgi:hypothetical protein